MTQDRLKKAAPLGEKSGNFKEISLPDGARGGGGGGGGRPVSGTGGGGRTGVCNEPR